MENFGISQRAVLCLSPGVEISTGCLRDMLGTEYPVNPAGELIARLVAKPVSFQSLAEVLARIFGMPRVEIDSILSAYVSNLQCYGLLSVHQSYVREMFDSIGMWPYILFASVVLRTKPIKAYASRRFYRTDARSILRAVVESQTPLLVIMSIASTMFIYLISFVLPLSVDLDGYRAAMIAFIVAGMLLFVMSVTFVHEFSHVIAARLSHRQVLAIRSQRLAVSVIYRRKHSDWWISVCFVSFAGPLAGFLYSFLIAGLVLGVFSANWQFAQLDTIRLAFSSGAMAVGVLQLLSLVPFAGDGRAIVNSIKEYQQVDDVSHS